VAEREGVAPEPKGAARASRLRQWLGLSLKLCLLVAAFAFILSRQPWATLEADLARVSPGRFVLACVLLFVCLVVATLRWHLLLRAYGASRIPPLATLLRVYWVGYSVNTFMPGGVGGDVLRGLVLRRSFAHGGATSGMTIVVVERALGLLGVVGVFSLAAPFGAGEAIRRQFLPYCVLGLLATSAMVAGVALGRRLSRHAPLRIARLLSQLPELQRPLPFVGACALSLATQVLVALSSHVLLASIEPDARLVDSLIATPAAAGAALLPISVAGAGPRDLVLVTLYTALGVPAAAAVATTFAVLIATWVVAGLGALSQLLWPFAALHDEPSA
jgi:uncharacterized membrane protein YbhN (UPF0104 family)